MDKIHVVEINPGKKINYSIEGNKITFGDDELTLNLKARERDYETQFDVCIDRDGCLALGVSEKTIRYAAQVTIPAREYIESHEEVANDDISAENPTETRMIPVDFDINKCTLTLWGMEE